MCVHISVSLKYASLLFNAYDFVTKSKISIVSFQDSQETKSKNLNMNNGFRFLYKILLCSIFVISMNYILHNFVEYKNSNSNNILEPLVS